MADGGVDQVDQPLLSRGLILRLRAGKRTTTATLKLRGPQVSASLDADTTTAGAPEAAADTPLDDGSPTSSGH